jgi:hypothetical protein
MKKLLFLIFLASLQFSSTQAQQISKANLILNKPVKATGTTQNKTTPATQTTVSVYSLTSVRVNIRTGNDNKEYPSGVRVSLGARGSNMVYAYFVQENLKNEMKSNSNTEFGMEKAGKNLKDITLDVLQNTGFELRIAYSANFQFDAWKIEGVSVTLEFRDQNGNLHPSLGQKTITFGNSNGFLNGYDGTRNMICTSNGYFNPLSAYIE